MIFGVLEPLVEKIGGVQVWKDIDNLKVVHKHPAMLEVQKMKALHDKRIHHERNIRAYSYGITSRVVAKEGRFPSMWNLVGMKCGVLPRQALTCG